VFRASASESFLAQPSSAATAASACKPVPGSDQIWSRPGLKYIWVGETHGSNETPAAFGDLVCNALANNKLVTVALERPSTEQTALENVLVSPDLAAAKKALLSEPGWQNGMDGRASEAMFRLLLTLRDLHKQYPSLNIFAMEGPWEGAVSARDAAMGHALLSLKTAQPEALVLVLSGNVHALREGRFGYNSAAQFLPSQELLSLQVTNQRGSQSWMSTDAGCGAQAGGVADKDNARAYGIYLDSTLARFGKVDGVFSLGTSLTASPPAAGFSSTLPDCRKKHLADHPTP
jgi:hypothetical protein